MSPKESRRGLSSEKHLNLGLEAHLQDGARANPPKLSCRRRPRREPDGRKPKIPARPPEEITKDIVVEREALAAALDSLSVELQHVTDAATDKNRAWAAGRKALIVVPAVAVAAGSLMGAVALLRRRRQRRR